MTATIHQLRPDVPVRCLDASPARSHAEALMRMLVKDKRIPRERLHILDYFDETVAAEVKSLEPAA